MKTTLLLLILCVLLLSCENEVVPPPPPTDPVPTIDLTVEDTGVTEMWLRVSIPDTVAERTFTLVRDGVPIDTAVLLTADSVFVDEGLLPNQQYIYQGFRISNSEVLDSTVVAQATTMDTTSHEFVWEIFEFGDGISSILLDVAIIDEDNVWAVGEIYINDSTGQLDPMPYNIVRWNGAQWMLERMPVPIFCGSSTWPSRANAVFASESSNVWISSGITMMQWDGEGYESFCISQSIAKGTINKIWGSESNTVFAVGNNGTILQKGGASWQPVESGTTLHVYDVLGNVNLTTGLEEIYAVAADQSASLDQQILRIEGASSTTLSDSTIPASLHGLWFKPGRRCYVAGAGIFTKRFITSDESWEWEHLGVTQYYSYAIRGNDLNDIVVCGGFGELLHFNGTSWRSYRDQAGNSSGNYYGIDILGDVCVAVGQTPSQAIIAVGRRQ